MILLKNKITEEIKLAMKNKDNQRRDVLRMIKNDIDVQEKNLLRELNDEEIEKVILKYKKTVEEQLNEAKKANRTESVEKFDFELKVVSEFLPEQISDEDLENIIREFISQNNINEKKQISLIMKGVLPLVKGKADGKKVNEITNKILG